MRRKADLKRPLKKRTRNMQGISSWGVDCQAIWLINDFSFSSLPPPIKLPKAWKCMSTSECGRVEPFPSESLLASHLRTEAHNLSENEIRANLEKARKEVNRARYLVRWCRLSSYLTSAPWLLVVQVRVITIRKIQIFLSSLNYLISKLSQLSLHQYSSI